MCHRNREFKALQAPSISIPESKLLLMLPFSCTKKKKKIFSCTPSNTPAKPRSNRREYTEAFFPESQPTPVLCRGLLRKGSPQSEVTALIECFHAPRNEKEGRRLPLAPQP
ncbi:hypothetical protein CEXT_355321 [Caerostris extrusa]|uniref:Uncharacterized protein n=1 Tax=Caerostris extrusa TaxID=172846 RepID=A0AAV4NSG9_CAEEX|nr:hypothetical protein CEXT_355321 [Caerostris extrusa]